MKAVKRNGFLSAILLMTVTVIIAFSNKKDGKNLVAHSFDIAGKQYRLMLDQTNDLTRYPRTSAGEGDTKYVDISDWTGGFWPGNLWYVFEYTHDTAWKTAAIKWTESLEQNQFNTAHHDLGFMMYCSYGNAYRITHNEKYKDVLVQSAKSLITRYNPMVGCIKSWNYRKSWDGKTEWHYPVIIDNLMNLELLFFASKATGDPVYKNIAIRHAETTMKNHIRPDYSSYHVVNYDTVDGKVLDQQTCQGFADNSTWARGQAWGIYGYTMIYRETGDKRFLTTAKKMADFYMNNQNLPADKVPYWDFNVNQKGYIAQWDYEPAKTNYKIRDASAAAVVCSALFELSGYLGQEGKKYKDFAISSMKTLSTANYLAEPGTNAFFLLKHSVGSFPHNAEIDVPIVYADYYYLEALLRYQKIEK
ncbi:glycoside hydrolase family 88 protein [Danxiaibacter flavus]|uniref:Glycoside hydrolase family 88 protein n=1 Tax=Danxiaibacter flavus TaxID=3049108 RepID=A0ABV3ZJ60_9BACT|nr:glycoside hydrolase family 88 protein [Chitinophagaceae bacterium DXS]